MPFGDDQLLYVHRKRKWRERGEWERETGKRLPIEIRRIPCLDEWCAPDVNHTAAGRFVSLTCYATPFFSFFLIGLSQPSFVRAFHTFRFAKRRTVKPANRARSLQAAETQSSARQDSNVERRGTEKDAIHVFFFFFTKCDSAREGRMVEILSKLIAADSVFADVIFTHARLWGYYVGIGLLPLFRCNHQRKFDF